MTISSKSFLFKFFLFLFAMGALLTSVIFKNTLSQSMVLNEISFQNNDGNDWIEIYNPSLQARSLKGFYLTDDKSEVTKFQIEKNLIIQPQGFVVIYGKKYKDTTEKTEKNLKISFGIKNGETVYLVDPNGVTIVDEMTVLDVDENSSNTIGKFPDGVENTFTLSTPTQGEKNKKDAIPEISPPQ